LISALNFAFDSYPNSTDLTESDYTELGLCLSKSAKSIFLGG